MPKLKINSYVVKTDLVERAYSTLQQMQDDLMAGLPHSTVEVRFLLGRPLAGVCITLEDETLPQTVELRSGIRRVSLTRRTGGYSNGQVGVSCSSSLARSRVVTFNIEFLPAESTLVDQGLAWVRPGGHPEVLLLLHPHRFSSRSLTIVGIMERAQQAVYDTLLAPFEELETA